MQSWGLFGVQPAGNSNHVRDGYPLASRTITNVTEPYIDGGIQPSREKESVEASTVGQDELGNNMG